jgi:hypothetical protein
MTLLEVDEDGLVGSPDGHITFLREDGRLRMWAPINGGTVELATTNFLDVHAMTIPAEETFWPRGNGFDSEYAGGSKVLRLPNGDLAMIYHGEHHPCAGDRAEVNVGLAISDDDGATWHRRGKILTASPYDFESCEERRFFGAGSFSGVVSPDGKYLYLYHHIWHPEQSCYITVSRSEISSGLGPGTWTRYYQDSADSAATCGGNHRGKKDVWQVFQASAGTPLTRCGSLFSSRSRGSPTRLRPMGLIGPHQGC